jgi:dihydropteroate synthase
MEQALLKVRKTIRCGSRLVDLSRPVVMGILNVTPDSFFDGGNYLTEAAVLERAEKFLTEGATFLDIGGYSTRPGAPDVPVEEELNRVIPAIKAIHRQFPEALISLDTFRAEVARQGVAAGAHLINDISGGTLDPELFKTVAELQVPYVLMHLKGTPQTMQQLAEYDDLLLEVRQYFGAKLAELHELGVRDVLLDPGFGFAKTITHNYELLRNLAIFRSLGCPLLIGISRKSMVYKALGGTPGDSITGTIALHMVALQNGATILRVHDVKEAVQTIALFEKLLRPEKS